MALLNAGDNLSIARIAILTAIASAALCLPARPAVAQREASLDEVKAAFVYQFANYIIWPAEVFADEGAPFVIGIVGNQHVAAVLRESARNKTVGGRPILIREPTSPEEAGSCQIVFLDRSDDQRVDEYLEAVVGKPILTVSDDDNFTEEGGIIKLYEQQNKVRFEINTDESDRSGLQISSKLLGLAKVVRDKR